MGNWGFLKTDHGRLCTPDLVCCFFEFVSYSFQRESIKYMNRGRISRLKIPIQIFEFPAILPWLPMMQLWAWAPLFAACTAVYKVSRAIAKRKEHSMSSLKSLVDSKIKWCCALSDRGHRVYLRKDNMSKQRKRYCFRAIFVWPWNENARIKQKQQTNGNRAIWLVYRTDTNARGFSLVKPTLGVKKRHPRELSRNQPILRFDIILQDDWPIEQCFRHIKILFGGKTKRPCFDLFIHWLIKQIKNTYRNHFSRSYESRSIVFIININRKELQRTPNEYAEERRIYKDLISKNEKETY